MLLQTTRDHIPSICLAAKQKNKARARPFQRGVEKLGLGGFRRCLFSTPCEKDGCFPLVLPLGGPLHNCGGAVGGEGADRRVLQRFSAPSPARHEGCKRIATLPPRDLSRKRAGEVQSSRVLPQFCKGLLRGDRRAGTPAPLFFSESAENHSLKPVPPNSIFPDP